MDITPVILAAGKGTRMHSALPKVLHPVGGMAMLSHVVNACRELTDQNIVIVYGHGAEQVKSTINDDGLQWALQKEQQGTGHAVAMAEDFIADDAIVIVAYGDVPLIRATTLQHLADSLQGHALTVLTTCLDNPVGYGRILRQQGLIQAIVEEKDANETQRKIKEVNTGFIAARGKDLKRWLKQLKPDNAQGEYYLTDCIALAVSEEGTVNGLICDDEFEVSGVNNRQQQAILEREYQRRQAQQLMEQGVTILDPGRIDVRGSMSAGKDVTIDVNTVFIGEVVLGDDVTIESGCVITNSQIGEGSRIKANSVIESAKIGKQCDIGPFARIRPDTLVQDNAKVGNFVEVKKSMIGEGSKISHLSYIGDTVMGKDVNIGAGTITCNYDGANKFQTTIGDDVFVGSDTQLVAPVTVRQGATIGAGSTITKDTPAGELTLSRARQVTIEGWQRPIKENK